MHNDKVTNAKEKFLKDAHPFLLSIHQFHIPLDDVDANNQTGQLDE